MCALARKNHTEDAMMKKLLACALALLLALPAGALAEAIALNLTEEDALVTPEGEVLVPPQEYMEIYAIGGGFYALGVYETGEDGFLRTRFALADAQGNALTQALYSSLECRDGVIYYEIDGHFGAMDAQCNPLVPCEYTRLIGDGQGDFLGFLALRTDPWDTTMDAVYALKASGDERETDISVIDLGESFSEGRIPALSSQTEAYGYLNAQGEWAIAPNFLYAGAFSDGMACAATQEGMGLIDGSGAWLLEPRFDVVEYGNGSLITATVYGEGVYLYDAATRQQIASFPGAEVYAAHYGDYAVIYLPEEVRLVGADGGTLLSLAPGASVTVGENRAVVSTGEYGEQSVYLYDFAGKAVAGPFQALTSAGLHGGRECFIVDAFSVVEVDTGGVDSYITWDPSQIRSGLVDEDGNTLLPCEYEVLYSVGENRFFARQGLSEGMIDASGNWIVRFEMDS